MHSQYYSFFIERFYIPAFLILLLGLGSAWIEIRQTDATAVGLRVAVLFLCAYWYNALVRCFVRERQHK